MCVVDCRQLFYLLFLARFSGNGGGVHRITSSVDVEDILSCIFQELKERWMLSSGS